MKQHHVSFSILIVIFFASHIENVKWVTIALEIGVYLSLLFNQKQDISTLLGTT